MTRRVLGKNRAVGGARRALGKRGSDRAAAAASSAGEGGFVAVAMTTARTDGGAMIRLAYFGR